MSIPTRIKIKGHSSPTTPNPSSGRRGNLLPAQPGVYLFKDKKRKVVYVGKATNLRSRVNSYWKTATLHRGSSLKTAATRIGGAGRAIDEMLHEVARIDWITTDSVIEALILEANLIRKYMPRYNVKEKDDKSFLYVVITREQWPRVELVRGNDVNVDVNVVGVASESSRRRSLSAATPYRLVFGPYTSASSIRAALDLIRKWFPWSTCAPKIANSQFSKFGISKFNARPCFDYHIGRCPGVCIGAVTRREYMKNIRNVILMLEGKKARVIKNVKLKMQNEAKKENFEEAENLRRKLFALQHIRDIAVLTKGANYESVANSRISNSEIRKFESHSQFAPRCVGAINVFGRVEGYDISNISGTNAVGSMVVFQDGEARKSEYRKFRIKTIKGINDVAMMKEMLERRFAHSRPPLNLPLGNGEKKIVNWQQPDIIVIDGGWGQVNVAREVLNEYGLTIPIVGIAKGFDRKQDQPIFDKSNRELARTIKNHKDLLLQVRDEAHRFAVAYHKKLREKRALST